MGLADKWRHHKEKMSDYHVLIIYPCVQADQGQKEQAYDYTVEIITCSTDCISSNNFVLSVGHASIQGQTQVRDSEKMNDDNFELLSEWLHRSPKVT